MKQISNIRVKSFTKLITTKALREKAPEKDRANLTTYKGRQEIFDILDGKDNRFVVITGPCSIHDVTAAKDYALRLLRLREKFSDKLCLVMRVYFEKPRTTIGWKGMINDPYLNGSNKVEDGLLMARQLLIDIAEMGVPTATELLDPIVAAYIGELVSWVAIGARTTESQTHRQMASGLSAPVGFKNGTDGNLDIAINAMESAAAAHSFVGVDDDGMVSILETTGNPYTHLVLRGGSGKANYHIEDIEEAEAKLIKRNFTPRIMVDCSHENSNKDHMKQILAIRDIIAQKKFGNKSIFGLMLESNINEGNQKLPADLSQLKYGVSLTDKCISWEETEKALSLLYDSL